MGLDTSSNISLWKDKALVETNVAVLWSFQVRNTSMSSERSVNTSFVKHYSTHSLFVNVVMVKLAVSRRYQYSRVTRLSFL